MYELGYFLGIIAVIFFSARWIYRKFKKPEQVDNVQNTHQPQVVVQKKNFIDHIISFCKMIVWLFIAIVVIIFLTLDWDHLEQEAKEREVATQMFGL